MLFSAGVVHAGAVVDPCAQSTEPNAPWGQQQITASRFVGVANIGANVLLGGVDLVFSTDDRYGFFLSCDGWVQKVEISTFKRLVRVRAGLRARNIAVSADGKWVAVANSMPGTLTILTAADLSVVKVLKITGGDGSPTGLSGVYHNPSRESFILALMDVPKIWEVFYGPNPPAFGFAHDWRMEGPVPQKTPFPIRKITTPDILENFGFDPSYEYVLAAARQGGGMVIDLVIGQKVADLDLPENPQFSKGIIRKHDDRYVMEVPHLEDAVISLVEMKTWEVIEASDR